MTRRSPRIGAAAAAMALAALGIVLGALVIEDPSTILPLSLEALLLGGVTLAIVRRDPDPRVRNRLGLLVLVALALRAMAGFLVHAVLSPAFFAPDSIGYSRMGTSLAAYWRGIGPDPMETAPFQLYNYMNGVVAYLLGDSTLGLVVLNVFLATWTAILTFHLGRHLLGAKVGWVAAGLAAAFPSQVLWSVLNIRDSLTTLLVVGAVFLGIRITESRTTWRVVWYAALVGMLWTLRDYMAFLVVAGTALGTFVSLRPGRVGRSLVAGVVLVMGTVFLAEQGGILDKAGDQEILSAVESIRRGFRVGAGSEIAVDLDTSTPASALRYLPVGIAIILLAPFPWTIDSPLQAVTLPEVIAWYLLLPFAIPGIRHAFRSGRSNHLVALTVLVVVVSTYALVEGNVGTAYRHRAQIMPLAFLYISAGVLVWWRRFWGRRRKRASRSTTAPLLAGRR